MLERVRLLVEGKKNVTSVCADTGSDPCQDYHGVIPLNITDTKELITVGNQITSCGSGLNIEIGMVHQQ